MTDHLLQLLLPPASRVSASPTLPFSTPFPPKNSIHQLQNVAPGHLLQCEETQAPGHSGPLRFSASDKTLQTQAPPSTLPFFSTAPRGAACCEVAYFLRDSLFAFHMLREYQEESHEGPLTIKSRGR